MKKYYQLLLALTMSAAALSSCSRANYAFNPAGPSYLGTTRTHAAPAVATPEPVLTASAETAEPAAAASPTRVSAVARAQRHVAPVAHRAAARPVAAPTATVETAAAPSTLTKAERKEVKQALRQAVQQQKKAVSPNSTAAEGKSQLVAALLCGFLGGIGVHRFYLGYTGRGILYIGLFLTSFLIIPGIALLALVIIDFVRILTGGLKPKGGEYAKTL